MIGGAAGRSAVLCASGSMGLTPFHHESFWAGIDRQPDVVAADAGSGDIGPYYLGSGHSYNLREWEERAIVAYSADQLVVRDLGALRALADSPRLTR